MKNKSQNYLLYKIEELLSLREPEFINKKLNNLLLLIDKFKNSAIMEFIFGIVLVLLSTTLGLIIVYHPDKILPTCGGNCGTFYNIINGFVPMVIAFIFIFSIYTLIKTIFVISNLERAKSIIELNLIELTHLTNDKENYKFKLYSLLKLLLSVLDFSETSLIKFLKSNSPREIDKIMKKLVNL